MTTLQEKLRNNGLDCTCSAQSYSECACDASWSETYAEQAADRIDELEVQVAQLKEASDFDHQEYKRLVAQYKVDAEHWKEKAHYWIVQNGRGGWIDDLRNKALSLEIRLDAAIAAQKK